jgi:hypothetical protein
MITLEVADGETIRINIAPKFKPGETVVVSHAEVGTVKQGEPYSKIEHVKSAGQNTFKVVAGYYVKKYRGGGTYGYNECNITSIEDAKSEMTEEFKEQMDNEKSSEI